MNQIQSVIDLELQYFNTYFRNSLKSEVPLLDRIFTYISQSKGKQVRPMFVILCARLGGNITDATYRAALFVEMIHASSLIHDDIVDDASMRRGLFSVNALWKSKVAVLTGDNLFTKSVLLLLENGDYKILKILSDSIEKVVEGELMQLDKSRKLNLSEEVYFEIIKSKTAALLASACAAGATSTFNNQKSVDILYKFGLYAGIAFQIKDDLFDYGNSAIGKPTGMI